MSKVDILEVHKKCLDFLLEWQFENQDFYFVPRKINNKKRLEKGMFFRGNESYLVLTFWDSADTKEFIYNINFMVNDDAEASIELSCRDSEERVSYVVCIKELMEKQGKIFKKTKKNRWTCFYPKDTYYLDALQDFILHQKPAIDSYLLQHPESGMPLADNEVNEKYVKAIPGYKDYIIHKNKAKKTGAVVVKASEYIMTLQHNKLSNELVKYLMANGYRDVVTEKNYVDIQAINPSGERIYFEIKTSTTVKAAIREALGQILEYNHYPNKNNAKKLIIVTECEAEQEDMQYLTGLRNVYRIPVYYQQFELSKKELGALI